MHLLFVFSSLSLQYHKKYNLLTELRFKNDSSVKTKSCKFYLTSHTELNINAFPQKNSQSFAENIYENFMPRKNSPDSVIYNIHNLCNPSEKRKYHKSKQQQQQQKIKN